MGEITFSGTASFVLFVGIVFPLAASLAFVLVRKFVPAPAWFAGLSLGALLLGTVRVGEPLEADNVDSTS